MRYDELLETRRPVGSNRPSVQPEPFKADVKLVVRFMPAVYRWLELGLHIGGPAGDIGIDRAAVWFPEIYDDEGALSVHCRRWIIEMVRDEVERLGLSIAVVFGPHDSVAVWPGDKLVTSGHPPRGGLRV